MGIEYELKFRADEQALQSVEAAFAGKKTPYEMQTTYYDTKELALSARKYTLRRRLENGVSVCTLKTPAKAGRQETEVLCNDIRTAIPELCKLTGSQELSMLVQGGLIPLCGAQFHRIAIEVSYEGTLLELALDKGILFSGSNTVPLCEIEVELKSGEAEKTDRFARELACRFGLVNEPDSKFRRASALYEGASL